MTTVQSILIGNIKKKIDELEDERSTEVIITERFHTISDTVQPGNGTVYFAAYGNENVTLPLSGNFKRFGSKIIIIANAGDKQIIPASEFSNDIVIYDLNAYDNTSSFTLANRGYVELMHTSGGWFVLSNSGFSVTPPQ